jgi:LuxR family maltose regulon positive regulatory protein
VGKLRRPRLAYHPAEHVSGIATLLTAPIGFGKSTLLRQWLGEVRGRRENAALMRLTASDRSIEGLAAHATRIAVGSRSRGVEAISADRVEQLFSGDHTRGLTLFIDNWDAILESESERRIAEIIAAGNLRVNLCIASRRACGLPLDIMLAEHRLRVIGQNALKFSKAEQRRLLGPALWNATSAKLLQACDGWPLALLLLKSWEHGDAPDWQAPSVFARRSGLEAIVTKQMLQACTPRETELLDILGLCADFDVALLNDIRDAPDSDELLEGISSLLPFDLHVEDTALRYRPAMLVRAIFQSRFDAMGTPRQKTLASRAFQKAMGQGRTLDAINFALLSGDAARAIELLESIGPMRLFMMYGIERFQDTLRRIPLPLLANAPRLKLAIPVTLAKLGYVTEAREMVEAAICDIESSSIAPTPKRLALRDGVFVKLQVSACTNRGWADDYEREAAAELAKEPAYAAWSTVIAGIVKHQGGLLDEAEALFDRAELACQQIRADYQLVHLKLHRAHVDLARGKLRAAMRIFRDVKHCVTITYPNDVGLLAISDLGLIDASLLASRTSVELQAIDAALAHLKQSDSWYEPIAEALTGIARCGWRDTGIDGVLRGLDDAEADLCRRGITVVSGLARALRTFYLMLAGRVAAVEALLHSERDDARSESSHPFWRERHLTDLAMSMLASARQDIPGAIAIADQAIEQSRKDGRKIALIEAYLNRASIMLPTGVDPVGQLISVSLALELAAALGAWGCLYEWRKFIEDHKLALEPQLQPRTREQLARLCLEWQGSIHPDLSGREVGVLKGVATGLTNKQLGRELDVSVETIKFHLKQCFRKLGAKTRAQAVQKAREAQLI